MRSNYKIGYAHAQEPKVIQNNACLYQYIKVFAILLFPILLGSIMF